MGEQFQNIRILKVRCKNHYLFGDMEFDFTNNGHPVDTIIIAGENGVGKSTLLDIILRKDLYLTYLQVIQRLKSFSNL